MVAVLFILLQFQVSTAGQKLRYNFAKGKAFQYSALIESKTSGQSMGQEFSITSSTDFDYAISLLQANASVLTLNVEFKKFNTKLNMPMMGFNDTTIVMKEYVGKRVKVIASDIGKTLSVVPIDTIPPSRLQMMAGLNPSDLFKQLLLELPEKEVGLNDSWKKDNPDTISRGGMNMVMKPKIEYKIVGEEKKNDLRCWKIDFSGTSTIEGTGNQRGMDVTLDGTVKMKGTMYFAPGEGIPVLTEQTSDTDMTTTFTGQQTGAQTVSVSASVKIALVK
jgi:hypothetical protein